MNRCQREKNNRRVKITRVIETVHGTPPGLNPVAVAHTKPDTGNQKTQSCSGTRKDVQHLTSAEHHRQHDSDRGENHDPHDDTYIGQNRARNGNDGLQKCHRQSQ